MSKPIPAVAYYRMSSDSQAESIPRQRESVEAFAKVNGYTIVREYKDEAISGDRTEKRAGFLRMRQDASELRDFKVILCWDKDRFGRFDSIEQGYWVKPLRDAGVRLVTVAQGTIDWNSFGGRIVDAALAESKHEFLRTLSHNIMAGQVRRAKAAYFNGGKVPYAFDRMLLDEQDRPLKRLRRGEKTDKAKGWHFVLVPTEDTIEIETVRWIFRTYVDTDRSLRQLALELNRRQVPGPASDYGTPTKWTRQGVRGILDNPHYAGDSTWGKTSIGKYHRLVGGVPKPITDLVKNENGNPVKLRIEDGYPVVKDAHKPIVERDLWQQAQAKRQARRGLRNFPGRSGYTLSGLLRCGHCGGPMNGTTNTAKPGRKAYRRYVCSNFTLKKICGSHAIREDRLLPALVRKIQEEYLAPERLERLRQRLLAKVRARREGPAKEVARLRAQIDQMDADIRQGARNLLRAGDNVDLVSEALSDLRRQRDRLARDLESLEGPRAEPAEMARQVEAAIAKLHHLHEEFDRVDPSRLRALLKQLVSRVELYFEGESKTVRTFYRFLKGVIRVRPRLQVSNGVVLETGTPHQCAGRLGSKGRGRSGGGPRPGR
jgi:DNA invertase Pin-like site-specific DNA recombinase